MALDKHLEETSNVIWLFHGTTQTAAQSILTHGVIRTFFTTDDAQLALEYANLRAVRDEAAPAIVEVMVLKDLLGELEAERSLQIRSSVPGCPSISQVTFRLESWERLNRCAFRGWRLDAYGLKEIACANYLYKAG